MVLSLFNYQKLLIQTKADYIELEKDVESRKSQRDAILGELSVLQTQKGIAIYDINTILDEKKRKKSEILLLENHISDLNNSLALKEVKLKEIDKEYGDKINLYTEKTKLLETKIDQLTKLIEVKSDQLKVYEGLEIKLNEKSKEVMEHEDKVGSLKKEIDSLIKTIEEQKQGLEKEKKVVQDLIGTNGSILANIEKEKHNLEIYVRRLQRYYDETGIRLQILPTFNLTKE